MSVHIFLIARHNIILLPEKNMTFDKLTGENKDLNEKTLELEI